MKLLTLFALPVLLLSCSSVHKTYSKNETSTDSSAVTHSENMSSAKHDSTVSKESADMWARETVIEFDTTGEDTESDAEAAALDEPGQAAPTAKANPTHPGRALPVKSHYRPTRMTIKETGTSQVKQSGVYTNKDTSYAMAEANTRVKDTAKAINKDKTSSRVPIGLFISGGLILGIFGIYLYVTRKTPVKEIIDATT